MRRVLLAGIIASLLLAGLAAAGNYSAPPGDYGAVWVNDTTLLYDGTREMNATGSPVWSIVAPGYTDYRGVYPAPGGRLLAFNAEHDGSRWLVVSAFDGTQPRALVQDGVPIAWVTEPLRIVYMTPGGTLHAIQPDGTGSTDYPRSVRGVPSPNGSRFAYVDQRTGESWLQVINADGSGNVRVGSGVNAVWSPDGTRLAYWAFGNQLAVAAFGRAVKYFIIPGAATNGSLVWAPSGNTIYGAGAAGLIGINVRSSREHALPGISLVSGPAFSPDGTQLAFAAGGDCRDRFGIYVANADGTHRHRITNSCTISGTDGPDVLHGDFSQVVMGLGGDDTLYADDTYYYFDGDSLYGGLGNDMLYGGFARDTLYGGPGDDVLYGGPSADILVGGPGRDWISGGTGNDVIGAQDGERDVIICGTNGPGSGVRDHDIVYADKIDVVARDCEVVYRR